MICITECAWRVIICIDKLEDAEIDTQQEKTDLYIEREELKTNSDAQ